MGREAAESRQKRHDAPLAAVLRSPEELHAAGWTHLGYDCVDMGFISGLTDCEFLATDRHAVLARFGPHLNRCGLFGDPAHAMEFCEVSNVRIPSHAPFEVCGIWVHPENADLSRVIG